MKSINTDTFLILDKISRDEFFFKNSAKLIGGTALAYYFNHRESFDIDISFPYCSKLPSLDFLSKYNAEKIEFDVGTMQEIENEGGDIDDYQQRFYIYNIKADFVVNPGSNFLEDSILKDNTGVKFNNIEIASPDTIFKQKSLLLLERNKIRDLYDIVYFLKKTDKTPRDVLETIKEYRITYCDKDIISLMKAKKQDDKDIIQEPISNPIDGMSTSYNILKGYLVRELEKTQNLGLGR